MIRFPFAKINIGLHVERKRADGFHDISSIFYPISLTDGLEFVKSKKSRFLNYGNLVEGQTDHNLVLRAYSLIKQDHNIPPLDIALFKKIPSGAGLGGGSADGAFMLTMLNDYFGLNISQEELDQKALQLGSDCPFFLRDTPCLATGRGEQLKPLPPFLKGFHWILIYPGLHISTKDAYKNIQPEAERQQPDLAINAPISEWKHQLKNDFESYAFNQYPELSKIKSDLYEAGALYASMTGSGSAIYGFFQDIPPNQMKLEKSYSVFKGIIQ